MRHLGFGHFHELPSPLRSIWRRLIVKRIDRRPVLRRTIEDMFEVTADVETTKLVSELTHRDRIFYKGKRLIVLRNRPAKFAMMLTGSMTPYDRREVFEKFKSSSSAVLCARIVLDEGIDVPDCGVIILVNGSRTKRQSIQRIGRGCRRAPLKIEYVYELIAGAVLSKEGTKVGISPLDSERRRIIKHEKQIHEDRNPEDMIEPQKMEPLIREVLSLPRCKQSECFGIAKVRGGAVCIPKWFEDISQSRITFFPASKPPSRWKKF